MSNTIQIIIDPKEDCYLHRDKACEAILYK